MLRTKTLAVTLAAAIATATLVGVTPANASTVSTATSDSESIVGNDGLTRTFAPDAINSTGIPGVSSTVTLAVGDALTASTDGQVVTLVSQSGEVIFNLTAPTLGTGESGEGRTAAKLVVSGDHIVVTPVESTPTSRSACASSFWGNVIFNVGMTGMCAALAVGTVVGGVVCTAALIGANTQINFDSQC